LRVKADFLAAGRMVVSFGDKMRFGPEIGEGLPHPR
jgi:hypothetical protein